MCFLLQCRTIESVVSTLRSCSWSPCQKKLLTQDHRTLPAKDTGVGKTLKTPGLASPPPPAGRLQNPVHLLLQGHSDEDLCPVSTIPSGQGSRVNTEP